MRMVTKILLLAVAAVTVGGGGEIAAPFTRVNGTADQPYPVAVADSFSSWSIDSASDIPDETLFTVRRPGFNNVGSAFTHIDQFWVTRKVRRPAPNTNGATLSPSTYALSENIWSTDTVSGSVTNNSPWKAPPPVAKWIASGRYTVGNTIGGDAFPFEIMGGHVNARSRQEFACVIFKISDGVNPPITVTVSAPTLSTNTKDLTKITVWALPATNISSLNEGLLTINADVYPWIGDTDSILKSENQSLGYEFSPQYCRKNVDLAANPPIIYVDPVSGNNSTAAVSDSARVVSEASALAAPALNIPGAIDRAQTLIGGGATGLDNLLIKLLPGTHVINTNAGSSRTQIISEIKVVRAPSSSGPTDVIVQSGSAVNTLNLGTGGSLSASMTQRRGAIRFVDMTWQRASPGQPILGGNATYPLEIHWEKMRYDRNGQSGHLLLGSAAYLYIDGLTLIGSPANFGLGVNTTGVLARLRGVGSGHTSDFESLCVAGCVATGVALMNNISPRINNRCVAYNIFYARNSSWSYAGGDVSGVFNSYNVYEYTSTTSNHSFSISNDSATYSNDNVICHHNTYLGFTNFGRQNLHYDEGSTARISRRFSYIGNIHVSLYTKGDRFLNEAGAQDPTDPNPRVGNWAFLYGVSCRDNGAQFHGNTPLGGNETQVFPGMGTVVGTAGAAGVTWNNSSATTRLQARNTMFVDYKGTTSVLEATGSGSPTTAQAGAGGGDYRLTSASIFKDKVSSPIRPYTLDGVLVGANDNMGAMSTAA